MKKFLTMLFTVVFVSFAVAAIDYTAREQIKHLRQGKLEFFTIKTDEIIEDTAGNGVNIDNVLLKDGAVAAGTGITTNQDLQVSGDADVASNLTYGVTITGPADGMVITGSSTTSTVGTAAGYIDGEVIGDDTIDNDSIDWSDMTDLDTDGVVSWGNIAEGELANSTVVSADIKDGTIASNDMANGDFGDFSISSGHATLDADVVAAAEMADADHGDVAWSSGVASVQDVDDNSLVMSDIAADDYGDISVGADGTTTLDDDTVAAAEMADADHGDVSWSSGVASVESAQGKNMDTVNPLSAEAGVGTISAYMGAVHYDVFTFTNVIDTATDGSDEEESTKLCSFPEGRILILGASIDCTVTCGTNFNASANDVFKTAIGTGAADDNGTLENDEVDIIAAAEHDTVSGTTTSFEWEADMTAGGDAVYDGTAAASSLYFELEVLDASSSGDVSVTNSGEMRVIWVYLGDD